MIRVCKVERQGHGITGRVVFEAVSDERPRDSEIAEAQADAGYDPLGYGDPMSLVVKAQKDGTFLYTWACWSSCD